MIIIENRITKEQFTIEPNTLFSIYDYKVIDSIHNLQKKELELKRLEELWARIPMRMCSNCKQVGVYEDFG